MIAPLHAARNHGLELRTSAMVVLVRAGTSDPIDATVVLLAAPGDRILTGDVGDLSLLADAASIRAVILAC